MCGSYDAGAPAAGAEQGRVDERVADYLQSLELERAASRNTVAAYRRDLRELEAWLTTRGLDPDALGGDELVPYANGLRAAGLAPATVRRRLAAARAFLRHRVRVGARTAGVRDVPLPREQRRVPRALTPEEAAALCESPDASPLGLRDRAALELLYGAGLRVSELCGLRLADVDREVGLVRCVGKGDRERLVPCGATALAAVDRYLARGRPFLGTARHREALVLNARGGRLSRQGVFALVRAHAERRGLPDWVGPHALRHAFATHLVQGGCDLRTVQQLLGHSRIATTEVYTHVAGVHLRETYLAAHPRARQAGPRRRVI
jgi:integrase/recombinase XerD